MNRLSLFLLPAFAASAAALAFPCIMANAAQPLAEEKPADAASATETPPGEAAAPPRKSVSGNKAIQSLAIAGPEQAQGSGHLREGTLLVDQTGYFRLAGDRATFYLMDDSSRFRVLENLALERVAREVAVVPAKAEWSVTGIVTEYRGENYLLITKAILKNRAPLGIVPTNNRR